jgi:hypothetical protein
MSDLDRVRTSRQKLWQNGYRPVPVWSPHAENDKGGPIAGAGKAPQQSDWRQRALRDPPDAVTASVSSLALNTGILSDAIHAVDADILTPELAESIVHRIGHMLGPTQLIREGRAPKKLLVYRAEHPLAKKSTLVLYLPDGTKRQVEVLGVGQQFLVDGIHPDTGQPYRWLDGSPETVPLIDLPIVTKEMLREMLDEVEGILRDAGAEKKEKPAPSKGSPQRSTNQPGGGGFFRDVNVAALANIEAWAPMLLPAGKFDRAGAWRITSNALARDLQEDLSIHPDGIWDYGLEEPRTAIDLVIEYCGASDSVAATMWLCGNLGATPESLGWHEPHNADVRVRLGLSRADFEKRIGPENVDLEYGLSVVGAGAGGTDNQPAGTGSWGDSEPPEPNAAPGSEPQSEPEKRSNSAKVGEIGDGGGGDGGGGDGGDGDGGNGDGGDSSGGGDDDGDDDGRGDDDGDDDGALTRLDAEELKKLRAAIVAETRDILHKLNARYFVISETGQVWVGEWRCDPTFDNRIVLDRITFADFRKLYLNRSIKAASKNSKGQFVITRQNLAEWWLRHPARRQYLGGVVFDPSGITPDSCLNLWRGFAVKPAPGDWSLMKDHIFKVICRGDPKRNDYLLNWLALMVQYPEKPGEIAIVIRSDEEGTGKGLLARYLVKLCGQHGLHITHAPHLTGRFNDHLHDCVFLFADEAFFAGDKAHGDVLKGLITEYTLTIEGKYRPVVTARNRLHLLIVSNRDWVVPASITARRFAVYEALDTHRNDRPYFHAIVDQMELGGLAAMLSELLRRDISGFDVRDFPETGELREQKALSLPSLDRWWLDVLARGYLYESRHGTPWFRDWHEFYSTALLMNSYLQWCTKNRPFDRKNINQLGTFLSKIYQAKRPDGEYPAYEIESIDRSETREIVSKTGTVLSPGRSLDEVAIVYKNRPHGYGVGELVEARVRFSEMREGIDMPWGLDPDE